MFPKMIQAKKYKLLICISVSVLSLLSLALFHFQPVQAVHAPGQQYLCSNGEFDDEPDCDGSQGSQISASLHAYCHDMPKASDRVECIQNPPSSYMLCQNGLFAFPPATCETYGTTQIVLAGGGDASTIANQCSQFYEAATRAACITTATGLEELGGIDIPAGSVLCLDGRVYVDDCDNSAAGDEVPNQDIARQCAAVFSEPEDLTACLTAGGVENPFEEPVGPGQGTPEDECIRISIDVGNNNNCIPKGDPNYITTNPIIVYLRGIIQFLVVGVGLAVAVALVIASMQYMSSRGNPQNIAAATGRLTSAIIALLTFIFMSVILNFLVPGGLL